MTDSGTAPAAGKKSPLDVLEEILNDAQAKSGQAAAGAAGGGDSSAAAADPAASSLQGATSASDDEQLAVIEAHAAEQAVADQAEIQQRLAAIEALKTSPENQARVEQEQTKAAQADEQSASGQGFQIVQLQHDKI